jgi:predicted transcriptional regulator
MTNTTELEVAITRSGLTKREIAKQLSLSEMGLYKKIHGASEFKASEIAALCRILEIAYGEREKIFFAM